LQPWVHGIKLRDLHGLYTTGLTAGDGIGGTKGEDRECLYLMMMQADLVELVVESCKWG
jgi:hypothetical protein